MKYFIRITATNKAKNDIDTWLTQWGYESLSGERESKGRIAHFFSKLWAIGRLLTTLKQGDTLVLQYPLKKYYLLACRLAHFKGAKTIGIVHDLGAFRRHKLTPKQEQRLLSQTDFLIVHNRSMEEHLRRHGSTMPMHRLEMFDYLSATTPHHYPTPHSPFRLVYAGALSAKRSLFFDELDTCITSYSLSLYGQGLDMEERAWKHIRYQGFLPSEEFIAEMEADFGLVWDGFSLDRCDGDWGEYLRINNPHKTSFYLRAGIPVIVWKEAAMASFIVEHHLGIAVSSLRELPQRLANLTAAEYAQLKESATQMSHLLGKGHYTQQALAVALTTLNTK